MKGAAQTRKLRSPSLNREQTGEHREPRPRSGSEAETVFGHVADFGRGPLSFLTRSVDAYGTNVWLRLVPTSLGSRPGFPLIAT